jgi:hypothetical protein
MARHHEVTHCRVINPAHENQYFIRRFPSENVEVYEIVNSLVVGYRNRKDAEHHLSAPRSASAAVSEIDVHHFYIFIGALST